MIDDSIFNPSYIGIRNDILTLIPDNISNVLDIGCSTGASGEQIQRRNNNVKVVGIEFDEEMAKIAKEKLDKVIVENIENISLEDYFSPNYFDCIIFADILEHLKDPWEILKNSAKFLNDRGVVIASIPNVKHYSTIINLLLRGNWPYRNRGIHDKTHLRFFTLRNINELFQYANLNIERIERNYRIIEKPHRFNRFSKCFAFYPCREFITFQYLIVAQKFKGNKP